MELVLTKLEQNYLTGFLTKHGNYNSMNGLRKLEAVVGLKSTDEKIIGLFEKYVGI